MTEALNFFDEHSKPQIEEPKKIPISCTKTIEFVSPLQIIRIQGMQNYSKVYLKNGSTILSNNNIGFYKKYLNGYRFFCCHKSHLINPSFIIRYYKDGFIEMKDGAHIPLSRRRKKDFIHEVLSDIDV